MTTEPEKCPSCHSDNPYNYRFGCLKHADGWHIRNQERQVKETIAGHFTPPAPPSQPIDERAEEIARELGEAWHAWLDSFGAPISKEFGRLAKAVGQARASLERTK